MHKDKNKKQPLLLNATSDTDEDESVNSDSKIRKNAQGNENHQIQSNDSANEKKTYLHCSWSWKCLCLTSALTLSITILILFLIIMCDSVPNLVQNALDNSSMTIVNGTIYNATNSSLTLNTTIMISNTGFFSATLKSTKATVTSNGIIIGQMRLPSLITTANGNTFVKISSVLQITNTTQFQISCADLLQNNAQKWKLSAHKTSLTVDTAIFGKIKYSVNLNKELVLNGVKLYNFIASDIDVHSATEYMLTALSNLNFITESIFTFILPKYFLMDIYYENTYIGYAPITSLVLKPGLNTLVNQTLIIEKYPRLQNQDLLNKFFSQYIAGKSQQITMKGPNNSHTVIDNVMNESVIAFGYPKGALAFGGLVTRASQQGWKVGDKTVRGAYSNLVNPVNVPMRIVNMSILCSLPETLKYHVKLVKYIEEYDCEEKVFAQLRIGEGMYKNDSTKTWIDVAAHGKATFFNIASPPKGSKPAKCTDLYPDFSCCFATLTAAYACKLNPGIQKKPSNGELSTSYMPMQLDTNISMLIDNAFKVETVYRQDFFALYFGYEVYAGYAGDLELSCKSFTFK